MLAKQNSSIINFGIDWTLKNVCFGTRLVALFRMILTYKIFNNFQGFLSSRSLII